MAVTAAQLNILFNSQGADRVKGDIKDVGGAVDRAGSGFDRLKQSALGFGTALIAPMGIGLKAAVSLEQSIANVNAALGGVDSGTLDKLTRSFQKLGAESKFSATEVAIVGEELAKAGFSVEELIDGATKAVVDLSQATGDSLDLATTGIVQALSTWDPALVGMEIGLSDASRAADILTTASNESSAGLQDIIAGMRQLGPIAAQMGISYEESAAAIALFTNNGLKGADAGVSLARGLQNLADPTSDAAEWMSTLGIAAWDMNGSFVGFPELFRQLNASMEGLDDQTKLTALSTIFGAEAMDVMGLAIMNGADPLEALIALMGESGAAAEQSAIRMNTLGAQFDTLKEGITTFLGSLVQGLIPGMRLGVDAANAFVDVLMRIPGPIKTVVGAISGSLAAWAAMTRAIQGFKALDMLLGGGGKAALGWKTMTLGMVGLGAGIAGLYLAWKKNVGGIQDLTERLGDTADYFKKQWQGAFKAFTQAGGKPVASALKATGAALIKVSPLLGRFTEFAGKAGKGFMGLAEIVGAYDWFRETAGLRRYDAAMATLGNTMHGVAKFLPQYATQLTTLSDTYRTLREQGMGPVMATLRSLETAFPATARVIEPMILIGRNLRDAFSDFLSGDFAGGFANLGQAALTLGNVVVDIAGWLVGQIPNVWDWLRDTALPAIGEAVVALGSVAVSIAGWVISAAVDIGSAIKDWLFGTGPTAPGVRDNGDLVGGSAGTQGALVTIERVAVNIGSWFIKAGEGLWDAISTAAQAAWTILSGNEEEVGPLKIKVGSFEVEIDAVAMGKALDANFRESTMVTPEMEASAEEAGRGAGQDIGGAIGRGLRWGIDQAFGSDDRGVFGSSPTGGAGAPTGIQGLVTQVNAWIRGAFEGIGAGMDAELSGPVQELSDKLAAKLNEMGDNLFQTPIDIALTINLSVKNIGQQINKLRDIFVTIINGALLQIPEVARDFLGIDLLPWSNPDPIVIDADISPAEQNIAIVRKMMDDMRAQGVEIPISFVMQSMGYSAGDSAAGIADRAIAQLKANQGADAVSKQPFGGLDFSKLDPVPGKVRDAKAAFDELAGAIPTADSQLQTFSTNATTAGQSIGVNLSQGLLNALPTFAAAMAGYTTVINTEAANMASAGVNAGAVAGFGVANGIDSAQGAIAGSVGAWVGIIDGAAGAMGAAGFNAGAAAGFGVANGLDSAAGAVEAAAGRIIATVNAAMQAAGEIHSPSRLTAREVGRPLGEGVIAGLDAMLPGVRDAAGRLVSTAGFTAPYAATYSGYGAGVAGGGTFAPSVKVEINVNGGDVDEEKLAELAATRTMQAIKLLTDQERHAHGMVMA